MPALIERPKMTRAMYQALKKHIMKQREKKKQEQEQETEQERLRKERESRKKKEEEDSLTLEQTKEQISQMESQLEALKQEKHELFSLLKKAIHEDETRRRQQMKEQSESMIPLGSYHHSAIPVSGHPSIFTFPGGPMSAGRPTMYKPQQPTMISSMKRPRSPSPPPVSMYTSSPYVTADPRKYAMANYAAPKPQHPQFTEQKPAGYPPQGHMAYSSQSGHSFPAPPSTTQGASNYTSSQPQVTNKFQANQSPAGKYPGSQSAFSTYPSHYAHQQQKIGEYPAQHASYPIPRIGAAHLGSPRGQLQPTVEGSKSPKDQYKMMSSMRGTGVIQQQMQLPPQQPPPRGSIMTGYPVRTQATTSTYQPPASQPAGQPRYSYPGQPQRFFGYEK
ncbi:G protein pathway suppressor 2 isoform X2 [Lingula anatina]|uniref:G protein pathway suppressor 2 isoform X2 n=1 Tax=Lingula anatina TaxID=7574 RepID=A0A1S3JLU2_LINAN|nr:G protein pathway suppressor 2 isoform X2 [Lingula anatina]|eukprot:XP_013411353.1 G protein pathway suppressor 2 isoform X2 [Lingula anatina]